MIIIAVREDYDLCFIDTPYVYILVQKLLYYIHLCCIRNKNRSFTFRSGYY